MSERTFLPILVSAHNPPDLPTRERGEFAAVLYALGVADAEL